MWFQYVCTLTEMNRLKKPIRHTCSKHFRMNQNGKRQDFKQLWNVSFLKKCHVTLVLILKRQSSLFIWRVSLQVLACFFCWERRWDIWSNSSHLWKMGLGLQFWAIALPHYSWVEEGWTPESGELGQRIGDGESNSSTQKFKLRGLIPGIRQC